MHKIKSILSHIAGAASSAARYAQNLVDAPAVVLLYHRVFDSKNDPELLCVSNDNFSEQIKYLKKKFSVLTAGEFSDTLCRAAKFNKGSILITFDDGYRDNFANALPVLEGNGLQAIFFTATANIDKPDLFFWDELSAIFGHIAAVGLRALEIEFGGTKFTYRFDSAEASAGSYLRIHRELKYSKELTRAAFMMKLRAVCGFDLKSAPVEVREARMMTSAELKKMSESGAAVIGAHTHTHTPLSVYGFNEQYTDISLSKGILEKITGLGIEYFSYPFGSLEDYDSASVEICRELGFKLAFSNFYWQCHRWTDRYQVPRMLVRNWDIEVFKNRLDKFFAR
ncbi:MAG TPA: hypothetical protein DC017_00950 [Candidatus Wallbacteria bacterium]|nr:hypothetical protein [Candidatus Wallbacteria bacterium]